MAGFLDALSRRLGRDRPDRAEIARVKELTRAALALPDDVALSVNEIVCADPACPGTETVILIMAPGARTRALKVAKPAAEIVATDVAAAAAAGADGEAG